MASEGVLATLQAGWQAVSSLGAAQAVIGGLALSAWNYPRYTRDADVLIVIKLLAGRIIDQADAAMLLRENRREIDFERLQQEVINQGLVANYQFIWRDAFPDEPEPVLGG